MLNKLSTFLGVFARGNKKNNVCRSDSAKKKTYFEPRAVVLNTKISLIFRLGIPVEGKINL